MAIYALAEFAGCASDVIDHQSTMLVSEALRLLAEAKKAGGDLGADPPAGNEVGKAPTLRTTLSEAS